MLLSKINTYEEKATITLGNSLKIGFVVYGSILLYNKDYQAKVDRGGTIGEHVLFQKTLNVNIVALEECGILWLPLKHYEMLRQESVKSGLKTEFSQLDAQIRLSFIHKKIK